MISSLRILLDRGKLVPRSAINWLLAVDRNGVASEAAERWARCHELALDVRTTDRGDALQNAIDAAMRCSRSSSQQQPRWIPSGAAAPRGKLIDGKHPIMPGMFYRYGSIIDAVDKRIKQLLFDVDDPLARGAERKLVGSVLDLSRAEEPETAARLVREQRVSSFNDALPLPIVRTRQGTSFCRRSGARLSHEERSSTVPGCRRTSRQCTSRTGRPRLALTFKKQRREDFRTCYGCSRTTAQRGCSFRAAVASPKGLRRARGAQARSTIAAESTTFDCPSTGTYLIDSRDRILSKIKWSRDPMLAVARAHPAGWRRKCSTAKRPSKASTTRRAPPTARRRPRLTSGARSTTRRSGDRHGGRGREPEPLSEMEGCGAHRKQPRRGAHAPPRTSSNRTSWRII